MSREVFGSFVIFLFTKKLQGIFKKFIQFSPEYFFHISSVQEYHPVLEKTAFYKSCGAKKIQI